MMKSMTGFGRAEGKDETRQCSVEMKSVNSRFMDISFRMPFSLNIIESRFRNAIQEECSRGKFDVYISFSVSGTDNLKVQLDENLAREYVKVLNQMMNLNPMIVDSIDLDLLASQPNVIKISEEGLDEEEIWAFFEPVVKEAIKNLVTAREVEGVRLKADIKDHLEKAREMTLKIEALAPVAYEESAAKLRDRVEAGLKEVPIDEVRFLNEITILSDKLAIDEEITRLKSHFESFDEILESEGPVGRKLDFLLQEFNRETNTIGSKTDNIEIINLVVDLKSEIEKMREQVQNIE